MLPVVNLSGWLPRAFVVEPYCLSAITLTLGNAQTSLALLSLTRVTPPTLPEGCCCCHRHCHRPGCRHLRRRSCVPSVASVTLSGCRAVVATGRCLGAFLLVLGGSPGEGGTLDGLVDLVAGLVGRLRGHVAQCEVVSVLLPRSCD